MGFDTRISNNKIFDYRQNNPPFRMDQDELPPERIKMVIRLSRAVYIDTVITSLEQSLRDFDVEQQGNNITVSGYPSEANFDEERILAIFRNHDPLALRI